MDLPGYQDALSSAAYRRVPWPAYLRVQGEDRLAFFQRQTTNDVERLEANRSLVSVLTSPAARILDVLRIIEEGEALGIIPLEGHGAATAAYLKSRIFFKDRVSLTDLSDQFIQIDLEGPRAAETLSALGFERAPAPDEVKNGSIGRFPCRVIGQPGLAGRGYRLLIEAGSGGENPVVDGNEAGAFRIEPLPEETYHVLRVEAGLPAAGAELTQEYTPLEIGLEWAVADGKGCYTGQEVMARQITYDKVTQRLVGLRLGGHAQAGERLFAEGKPAGVITSEATSPRFGEIALAVVKKPHLEPGTALQVGSTQDGTTAVVTDLPFTE